MSVRSRRRIAAARMRGTKLNPTDSGSRVTFVALLSVWQGAGQNGLHFVSSSSLDKIRLAALSRSRHTLLPKVSFLVIDSGERRRCSLGAYQRSHGLLILRSPGSALCTPQPRLRNNYATIHQEYATEFTP